VPYEGKIKKLELYIIPSLSQDLYLGINFWTVFELLPPEMNIDELTSDAHVLPSTQHAELQAVVGKFPSFVDLRLGKTSILSHSIDVGDAKTLSGFASGREVAL